MVGHEVFVTGGTGYIGRALIPALLERGHIVRALVRPGSEHPPESQRVIGVPEIAAAWKLTAAHGNEVRASPRNGDDASRKA